MEAKFKKVQEEIERLKVLKKAKMLTNENEKLLKELETLMDYAHSSLQLPCKEEKNFEIEKKHKEWTDIPIEVSLRDFSLGFSECYLWLKNKMT